MSVAAKRLGAVAFLAALALGATGCGGGGASDASPQAVLQCLNAHKLGAEIAKPGHQYNIAALHEIRIPLGEKGESGDGFVEFLDSPDFAKKVAGSAKSNFHYVTAAQGAVVYEYSPSTPAGTGEIIKACAFSSA